MPVTCQEPLDQVGKAQFLSLVINSRRNSSKDSQSYLQGEKHKWEGCGGGKAQRSLNHSAQAALGIPCALGSASMGRTGSPLLRGWVKPTEKQSTATTSTCDTQSPGAPCPQQCSSSCPGAARAAVELARCPRLHRRLLRVGKRFSAS